MLIMLLDGPAARCVFTVPYPPPPRWWYPRPIQQLDIGSEELTGVPIPTEYKLTFLATDRELALYTLEGKSKLAIAHQNWLINPLTRMHNLPATR